MATTTETVAQMYDHKQLKGTVLLSDADIKLLADNRIVLAYCIEQPQSNMVKLVGAITAEFLFTENIVLFFNAKGEILIQERNEQEINFAVDNGNHLWYITARHGKSLIWVFDFKTNIPVETIKIRDNDEPSYCLGIVFHLSELEQFKQTRTYFHDIKKN